MVWFKANHKPLTEEDKMKYEIARELGLLDKVIEYGWGGLTAGESGKIGGIITKRKKLMQHDKEHDIIRKEKNEKT